MRLLLSLIEEKYEGLTVNKDVKRSILAALTRIFSKRSSMTGRIMLVLER